jgi:ADP-heptose:LPS heptosyltransferase
VAVSAPPTVVALRALGLGDLLTALPALRAIAAHFPEHHRVLVTPRYLAPLLEGTGVVHEVVPHDAVRSPDSLRSLALPGFDVDVAINLHGRGPESSLALASSEARRIIAFAHDAVPSTSDGPSWCEDEHEVHRWCRLLEESGVPADPENLYLTVPVGSGSEQGSRPTVLHPGASSAARRWPDDRWAALASALERDGHRVVLTGVAADVPLCGRIRRAATLPGSSDLSGRTSLPQLAALLAGARLVVVGDTGVAHLATAVRAPSVVLFGPEPPSRWGPPADARHVVIWRGLTGDPNAAHIDDGLAQISTGEVLDAIRSHPAVGELTSRSGR